MSKEQVTFAFITKNKRVQNDDDEKRSNHKRKRLLGIPTNGHFIFSLLDMKVIIKWKVNVKKYFEKFKMS